MQGTGCLIIIIAAPIVLWLVAMFTDHGPVMWNLTGLVCGLSIAMVWIRRNDRETKFQKLRAAVIAHVGRPPDHDLRLREAGKQDRLLSVFVPEKKFYVGSGEFEPANLHGAEDVRGWITDRYTGAADGRTFQRHSFKVEMRNPANPLITMQVQDEATAHKLRAIFEEMLAPR